MAEEKPPKLDHDLIRELAKLLGETGLTEIAVETNGLNIRVARAPTPVIQMQGHSGPPPVKSEAPLGAPGASQRVSV